MFDLKRYITDFVVGLIIVLTTLLLIVSAPAVLPFVLVGRAASAYEQYIKRKTRGLSK